MSRSGSAPVWPNSPLSTNLERSFERRTDKACGTSSVFCLADVEMIRSSKRTAMLTFTQFVHFSGYPCLSTVSFGPSVSPSVFLPSLMLLLLFHSLLSFYALSIRWRSASPPSKEKVIRQVDVGVGQCYQTFEWRSVPMGGTAEHPPSPLHNQADRKISSFSCCLISDPIPLFLCAVEYLATLCTLAAQSTL
jgi:hypothetical protein